MVNRAADDFLKERYYQEGEDWEKMCCRVADFHADTPEEFKEYFDMLSECKALPNSPALMNSGTKTGYLSACNLIPVPDDLEGIMDAVKAALNIDGNFKKITEKPRTATTRYKIIWKSIKPNVDITPKQKDIPPMRYT